jgi:hypothetical protein
MRTPQFIVEGPQENTNVVEMFKKFLPLAMEVLEVDSLPKMQFAPELNTSDQPSFGMYSPDDNMLAVALSNRHPVDILRTVAHELVHFKQNMNGELHADSGETWYALTSQGNVDGGNNPGWYSIVRISQLLNKVDRQIAKLELAQLRKQAGGDTSTVGTTSTLVIGRPWI